MASPMLADPSLVELIGERVLDERDRQHEGDDVVAFNETTSGLVEHCERVDSATHDGGVTLMVPAATRCARRDQRGPMVLPSRSSRDGSSCTIALTSC